MWGFNQKPFLIQYVHSFIFSGSLVSFLIFSNLLFASLRITQDVFFNQVLGKVFLHFNVCFAGFILPEPKSVCHYAPYAPRF